MFLRTAGSLSSPSLIKAFSLMSSCCIGTDGKVKQQRKQRTEDAVARLDHQRVRRPLCAHRTIAVREDAQHTV